MTRHRITLLLLAVAQLLASSHLAVSLRDRLYRGEGYLSRRTAAQIVEGLEQHGWVDPERAKTADGGPTAVILPIVQPRLRDAHEQWRSAVWLLGGFGLGFFALALLPERWLQRSRASDKPPA